MSSARISLMLACVIAGGFVGQSLAQQKVYRWVDKQGNVHISDQLPPEAVGEARTEFNAKTGSSMRSVSRQMTSAERMRFEEETAAAARATAEADLLKRMEAGMLVNYETEDQLQRAFEERINLVRQTLEATQISIKGQKAALLAQLDAAAEDELSKREVKAERAAIIRQMHGEIVYQQRMQIKQQASRAVIDQEFERVLARYRVLRGAQPASAASAPQTSDTPSTK